MDKKWIKLEQKSARLAVVTLKRGEKRNALSMALMEEFCETIDTLAATACSCAIIAAEGSVFCAGLDLIEAVDPALEEPTARLVMRLLTTLYRTSIVTIAAVQGDAFAGGAGIAAACDLVVMAQNAHIGFPEVRRGLVAAIVGTLLSHSLSGKLVRELLLTGEPLDAERALAMGLATRLCATSDVYQEAINLAQIVLLGGPEALKLTKQLLMNAASGNFSNDLQQALIIHHTARCSNEAKEGIQAFLEKRNPAW